MTRVLAMAFVLAAGSAAAAPSGPAPCPPRSLGPAAAAHTRVWRHGRTSCRVTRRTPAVMWEEAARVPRGEIFGSWSSAARQ